MTAPAESPPAVHTPTTRPILEMRGITKRFPGVVALNGVSFDCLPGEVHALVGENGAGKSTLMKVLVGAYQPDEGEIWFAGKKVTFNHPREAQQHGLSIIYQEFNLLPYRTVAQNIFLGREPVRYGMIDNRAMEERTAELLKRLNAGDMMTPRSTVKDLSVAQQQIVEIAKALSFDSRVLVMDEPTAALSTSEVETLFDIVRGLQANGIGIIYITHRFKEIFDLAQRVTVLKDGQRVDTVAVQDVTSADLVRMMVGRELDHYYPPYARPEDIGPVRLSVRNGSNHLLHDINFDLRAGEIVGIAGLQGSGRTELAQALFGVVPFTSGTVEVNGTITRIDSPLAAIRRQMGFITEDRKGEGISPNQSVRDNVLLAFRALRPILSLVRGGNGARHQPPVEELTSKVDVRAVNLDQEVQYLSGGNQQKVVLAKWLATASEILIFDEPTRGIDVSAKAGIHDLIRDLARSGTAVLMISSELPEVIGMSDRILVMREGRIVGELPAGSSEADIMLLATGQDAPAQPQPQQERAG